MTTQSNIAFRKHSLHSTEVVGFHFIWPLLMTHPGDPQLIIAWLVETVGITWRYRRTVKFLSEIIKNGKVTQR